MKQKHPNMNDIWMDVILLIYMIHSLIGSHNCGVGVESRATIFVDRICPFWRPIDYHPEIFRSTHQLKPNSAATANAFGDVYSL